MKRNGAPVLWNGCAVLAEYAENNMSEKGLTNISLKKINKSKVYQYIYRKKKIENKI